MEIVSTTPSPEFGFEFKDSTLADYSACIGYYTKPDGMIVLTQTQTSISFHVEAKGYSPTEVNWRYEEFLDLVRWAGEAKTVAAFLEPIGLLHWSP
jgi:hypothetical protein